MKKFYIYGLLAICLLSSKGYAEELTWGSCTTYAPIPVLFIHGINANMLTWEKAIPELEKYFGYRLVRFNKPLLPEGYISKEIDDRTKGVTYFKDNTYESPSQLYLETFDYGGKAKGVENLFIIPACEGSFYPISSYNDELGSLTTKILAAYYGDEWKDNPEAKINIVAHSMGGLVSRYYLQHGGADKVNRLITIGTPHKGSGLATLAKKTSEVHPLCLIGFGLKAVAVRATLETIPHVRYGKLGAVEDLRPNSAFLKELNAKDSVQAEESVEHVAIVGLSTWFRRGDLVVNKRSQLGEGVLDNVWIGTISAHHLSETKNWEAIRTALDGIPDKGNKYYDTPRIIVRFANKLPDSTLKLDSASVDYKGGKENFHVVGKMYDYLAGSATVSIELNDAGNYAKDKNNNDKEIRNVALNPLQMGTETKGDVSSISGDEYNTYFAYKLNLDGFGTGTHHLRVTITNPASLTTIATTKNGDEWMPFTITENRVNVRVAMAASPAVDIPQGIVAKADCYYFDNQGHVYEKPLYDNLRVESDSIIRYNYSGNAANPNYSHRILLESRVEGLDTKKPIASVVNGNTVYTYASDPFKLIETTNINGEVVYMADVNNDGTITESDRVVIQNNNTVKVPRSKGYDSYTNPVGALYILKDIQQAYNYAVSLENSSGEGQGSPTQSNFNPIINISWAQNKDYTANSVSSYGTRSGRIEVNGKTGDEFKPDRICQAYGNYLLSYYCNKHRKYQTGCMDYQFQLTPDTRPMTLDEAFVNGLCMRFSAGVRGVDTASVPGRDEIVRLGSSSHRGVNSSIAVAQGLSRLPMQQIWQALYHPTAILNHSGCTVIDLLDEIDSQMGSGTTKAVRDEFFAEETSGGGTTTTIPTISRITISPASMIMSTGGTATFTAQAYDQAGDVVSGIWTPEWCVEPGLGTFAVMTGTAAVFIADKAAGTVTVTARYGTLSATAQVVIAEKGPIEVKGSQEGVWYKRLSPYIVTGDIIVDKGKTLKIEPGVAVVFMRGDKRESFDDLDPEDYKDDPWMQGLVIGINDAIREMGMTTVGDRQAAYNRRVFTVMGRLEAEGTADEKIIFTSGKKIDVASSVYEGMWKYLQFTKGSSGILRYCDMLHGGLRFGSYRMNDLQLEPQVLIESSDVNMERCRIYESAGIGIQIKGVTNCVLKENEMSGMRKNGIVIEDSRDVLIEGNTISGVETYGIQSVCGVTGTITRNKITDGTFPFCQDGTSFPVYSNNIIAEGKGIAIMNGNIGLPETGVLKDAGTPYIIHRVNILQGRSLRIEKGVVCLLGQLIYQSGDEYRNSGKITVQGRLFADGATFKSREGGYWPWNCIILSGEKASESIINNCIFEGGGYVEENQYDSGRIQSETGMIRVESSGPRIEGCVFKGSATHFGGSRSGIMLKNPQPGLVITNNRIETMSGYGIFLENCQYSPEIYKNTFIKNPAPFHQDANSSVKCMANTYIENTNTAIVIGDIRYMLSYGGGITPAYSVVRVPLVTWCKQDLPYLLNSWFEVSARSTLKIEPGCVIKMIKGGAVNGIDVNGRLEAEGIPDAPIIFTSINDDECYDDNKLDPKPGDGSGIRFYGTSTGVFKHCVVKYGEGIMLMSANSPIIENCTFTKNVGCVIYVENCSPVIRNNTISHNVTSKHVGAITLSQSSPRIENNIISQNEGNGIYHGIWSLDSGSCPMIIGNTIESNGGLSYYHPPAGKFIYQGNVVKGNGYQAIGINCPGANRVDRDTIWKKEELPYLVMWNETIVDEGKTLTIEPGVVVKFMDFYYCHASLLVKGSLLAEGTADKRIVFTSMYDDSAGGKTINMEGFRDKQPSPGSWAGIVFSGGKGTLTNCCIQYGRDGLNLLNNRAHVVIKNSKIRYNSSAGVKNDGDDNELVMEGCTVTKNDWGGLSFPSRLNGTLSYNNIYNNCREGIYVGASGSRVEAVNNWWGTDAPCINNSSINYKPWLNKPYPNVASLIDHLNISPATFTLGQDMKWRFNVGAYDKDGYLLPSPGFMWEVDEKKGNLTINDTIAVFQAATKTGTTNITVRWGSLSTTSQVRIIEYSYGTISGTFAMRRNKEIWLMSADGQVLREVSRDKTADYPKLSRCGRYLAYGKQGYSENQRSLFRCDLKEGIEKAILYAYWHWEGNGPQRRVISGWTFVPWEPSVFWGGGICQYPAMDDSGRIFGYNPNTEEIYYQKEGKAVALASSIKNKPYPVISPDGVWLAYLKDGDIYITDTLDGLNRRRVTNTNRVGGPFAWSSDGQSIVYPQKEIADNTEHWDLWMITAGGTNPKNITNTPDIDEDQVDWSSADIMENMPKISRIGIVEPEVAVVTNGSITLKPCVYYQVLDEEGYPIEYRIIGGRDFSTTIWRLEGGIGTLSNTTGREVVYYGGNKCGEGSLTVSCGSYTESLRVVVASSIIFPCIMSKGILYQGGDWWWEKDGEGKYPIMEVWIDGKRMERVIVGEEWREYPVRYSLLPGTHTIDICFTNDKRERDLFVEWVKIGSISLKPTYSLVYDRGTNNKADTWFDGQDIISESEWRKYGKNLCMPWTGALRFNVYVVEDTEISAKAANMSQIIMGLSEKVYVFPNPWCGENNCITFVGMIEGARLQVYNIAGERVFERVLSAGDVQNRKYLWKPENNDGQSLASGVYLYIVSYGDEMRIGKMGVVK